MKKLSYLFGSLVLLLPSAVIAWTTPIKISGSGSADYFTRWPAITAGKDSSVHVVWDSDMPPGEGIEAIFYRSCEGDSWGRIVGLSTDSVYVGVSDIATDTSGYPHVVWSDWNDQGIHWTHWNGASWTAPIKVFNLPGIDDSPVVTVDRLNRIHLFWRVIDYGAFHSIYDGENWLGPYEIYGDSAVYSDVTVDSKGNLHLAWGLCLDPYCDSLEIFYSNYDGEEWSPPVNISNLGGWSVEVEIAVDSNDFPHVVWEFRKGGNHIYYTFFNGNNWVTPYKISGDEDAFIPTIALDSQDNVHVAWGGESYEIWYTIYDGTTWSEPIDISDPTSTGLCPELALDSIGCLHAVWAKGVTGDGIYHSKHSLVGIDSEEQTHHISKFNLLQNFPNPFSLETEVLYILTKKVRVTIVISDLTGRIIKRFDLGYKSPGLHTFKIALDSLREGGGNAGIYFCNLRAGSFSATRKLVVLK